LWGPGSEPLAVSSFADAIGRIEQTGFDSVWIADTLNRGYVSVDPLTAAAAMVVMTTQIEIGTAVLQLGRHNGVDLAQRLITLSMLAEGRFTLGAGAGSTEGDFLATGANFSNRFQALEQNLATVKALCSGATLEGVDLHPWPAAVGLPPIVIGSWAGSAWIKKAAVEFDGWMGSAAKTNLAKLQTGLTEFRRHGGTRAIAANLRVDLSIDDGNELQPDAPFDLRCTPEQAARRLKSLADLGFDDVILTVFDHTQQHLDQLRSLVAVPA
jgi:alkanesulfonate monooxygenase SsuD/methylene tetrahydromethanopterin reductase-like flavin-dependent oxidoreductase (luciferase family)